MFRTANRHVKKETEYIEYKRSMNIRITWKVNDVLCFQFMENICYVTSCL